MAESGATAGTARQVLLGSSSCCPPKKYGSFNRIAMEGRAVYLTADSREN